MDRMRRAGREIVLVLAVALALLTVTALVTGTWWLAVALGVITVGLVVVLARGGPLGATRARDARSRAAAARWRPEQVAAIVQEAGGQEVQAVRRLRQAEPELTLRDAVALIRGPRP